MSGIYFKRINNTQLVVAFSISFVTFLHCSFNIPEHNFYWIEEWTIWWQKNRVYAQRTQIRNIHCIAVNACTIKDPYGVISRILVNFFLFYSELATTIEKFSSAESSVGTVTFIYTVYSNETKQGHSRFSYVFTSAYEPFAMERLSKLTSSMKMRLW